MTFGSSLDFYPEMSSCCSSIVKSWPKQYLSGQNCLVYYRKSGPMLLSLHILQLLMQNRQTYPQYLRLWKNALICQWTLAKSLLSKHLINNFMQVKWSKPDILELHILRLGRFVDHCLSFFIDVIVLSVLWITASGYPFGIFKLFLQEEINT